MAPRRRANCQICEETESRYACPKCNILYCSVSCFKRHKASDTEDFSCIEHASRPDDTTSDSTNNTTRGRDLNSSPSGSKLSELQSSQVVRDDQSKTVFTQTIEVEYPALPETKSQEERTANPDIAQALNGETLKESGSGSTASAETGQLFPEFNSHAAEPSPSAIGQNSTLSDQNSMNSGGTSKTPGPSEQDYDVITEQRPLRKLTSLKWPYVPDEPSYPDPLKRDDPKPLNLKQYESIATSAAVRRALSSHSRLPALLTELDKLRGSEREEELERVLGVSQSQSTGFSIAGLSSASDYISSGNNFSRTRPKLDIDGEDMKALRELAEAVESAVRGERADVLGLDWEAIAG